jgi:hypothetical protein
MKFLDIKMAERVGFEPTVQLPRRILSKDVLSATQPSLQIKTTNGGERGIRTPGEFHPTTVFKTAALNRSAISPNAKIEFAL